MSLQDGLKELAREPARRRLDPDLRVREGDDAAPTRLESRVGRDALISRMTAVAASRGWVWPALSVALAMVGATVVAVVHQQIDLTTYLLGGAHAWAGDLFSVTLPKDGLGFTYPPFSALLFAPFAHLPLACARSGGPGPIWPCWRGWSV